MTIERTSIFIEGLRFHAYHGVMPQERVVGHEFDVDIRLWVDYSDAIETDELTDTVNYAEVYEVIKAEMAVPSKLVEHVTGRIAKSVLAHFEQVMEVEVRLRKVNPPMGADCKGVGVTLKAKR